jgi:hypothetical protein
VKTDFDDTIRLQNRRLAELRNKAAKLERDFSDARLSLEREIEQASHAWEPADPEPDAAYADAGPAYVGDAQPTDALDAAGEHDADGYPELDLGLARAQPDDYDLDGFSESDDSFIRGDDVRSSDDRTDGLVSHGRASAHASFWTPKRIAVFGAPAVVLLLIILFMALSGGGAAWPASVARVQAQAAKACQNPDVKSEPGQVNFACAKATRQILWVFALLTSANNPEFADAKTGRVGLEPITPSQGGEVAWSLNLHHPYDATNPIDSIAVAARAINNIIGGATVTGSGGKSVIQPGLESDPSNCIRYTGSAAMNSRKGFPRVCADPVSSQAGQAALVADVYQKWIVGAGPRAAQNAALLFENADNPGNPQVQAIVRQVIDSQPHP